MERERAVAGLHQVAQHAEDLDRAITFYSDVLGFQLLSRFDPPGLAFFRLGDTRLLLDRAAPSALIYLRVDDVRAEAERLRAAGVTIDSEPHVVFTDTDGTFGPAGSEEWMAFFRDSEGNLVGLASTHEQPS
jgi:methylmalonyl-CoA/ethylmalonyl-CoA epimerase